MASILNNSSFLFNPAGSIIAYEEDKIFSVLPNDGTVDGVVGGNSGGGTRVNQQGYIESVPANFMLNSGTTWGVFNVTVTTGVTDPVGGTGAYTISDIASGNITEYAFKTGNTMPLPAGTTFTYSIRMKGSGTIATYLERSIAGTYWFNVKTHTLSNEWQTFTHTYTVPTDASGFNVYVGNATGTTATSVDVAFPMVNYGSTAKPYQPTTDRLGYPPIDYKNGKGKLLQEPQRTNLALQSNIFPSVGTPSNVNGLYFYSLATLNSTNNLSPDGTNNAYNITMHSAVYDMYSTFTGLSVGTTYCYSLYVKLGSATNFAVVVNNTAAWNTVAGSQTFINLNNTDYTRAIITFVAPSTGQVNIHLGGHAENITQQSSGDVYIWGEQFEAGSFPTSYIPTTSATVTRAANDVIFNSPGPTKAFATKPGVILYDFDFYNFADGGGFETFLYNGGTTGGDYFYFAKLAGNGLIYWDGNNANGYFYAGSFVPKQGRNKIAWYFTETNSYWYVNGSLLYTGVNFDTTYFPNLQTYAVPGNNFAINTLASIPNASISQAQVQAWTNFNSGSGGTISYYGPYTIHTFTGSATFTPSFSGQVEVLVVAGGGSGGGSTGGGGGAGGLVYASSYGVSQNTGITVTVGAGGAGVSQTTVGNNGSNSVFGALTAIGGGGGGMTNGSSGAIGRNGGSGGGGAHYTSLNFGTPGTGILGQGNNGGNGSAGDQSSFPGGGGGGAGVVGGDPTNSKSGNGGNGLTFSISGYSTTYAGGGGGGSISNGGNGGVGGGAPGTSNGTAGGTATANTGGGGGGGWFYSGGSGGAGGSGIVIVRYLT
jgi:hypothetical protein